MYEVLHVLICSHFLDNSYYNRLVVFLVPLVKKDRNIDLPRKVRFRERYKKPEFKVDISCRIGRSYEDFAKFMEKNPDTAVVQMDSVIGSKGGKCLLTIHFVDSSFMLAFLRDANTSKSVIDIFSYLYELLGDRIFKNLFPIINRQW